VESRSNGWFPSSSSSSAGWQRDLLVSSEHRAQSSDPLSKLSSGDSRLGIPREDLLGEVGSDFRTHARELGGEESFGIRSEGLEGSAGGRGIRPGVLVEELMRRE